MIYNGQTLIANSMFLIQFHLINCDDIELGALLNALQCYIDTGCDIGGMSRIGHGKIGLEFIDDGYDYQELINNYRKHVAINVEPIKNWLNETFPFIKKEVKVKEVKEKIKKKKDEESEEIQMNIFEQE
jgi:hypothetical protein